MPFTLTSQMLKQLTKLSGVSLDAVVSCGGQDFRENILFTHRGLSGPAILQISTYWQPGTLVSINLLPDEDVLEMLTADQSSDIELATLLSRHLPKRFAQAWCELYAASRPLKQYNKRPSSKTLPSGFMTCRSRQREPKVSRKPK